MQGSNGSKLAINGGAPVAPNGLEARWPIYDELEEKLVLETLHSGAWCCMGRSDSMVAKAERKFAEFIGTKYATAVPTGTDALTLAFRSIGLEPGDEVIVPAVTFIASASAVTLATGVPIFVDVDPETYQISPDAVEAAVTDRTRAIEPVHYGGYPADMDRINEIAYPADMDRINEIAKKHNLFGIEDACEAHGTEWRGKKAGSLGDMGCFSFQMGKPLTCGEGGGITYDDEDLAMSCYAFARLGRKPGGEKYKHYIPAGNFRMSEYAGAILLAQLSRIEEQTEIRHRNGEYLAAELEKIEGISALKRDPRITKQGYYFYLLRYDSSKWNNIHRNRFMEALNAEGIGCGTAHNDPLYLNPAYREIKKSLLYGNEVDYTKVHCPEAERIYKSEVIALGKDFLMSRENVDKVLEAIGKIRDNIDELKP